MAGPLDDLKTQIKELRKALRELSNLKKGLAAETPAVQNIDALNQELALTKQLYDFATMQAGIFEDRRKAQNAVLADLDREIKLGARKGTLSTEELKTRRQTYNTLKSIRDASGDITSELEKQVNTLSRAQKSAERMSQEYARGLNAVRSLGSELLRVAGVGKDFNDTVLGKITDSFAFVLTQVGEIGKRISAAKFDSWGIASEAIVQKMAGTVSTVTKELFFAQDRLRAEFFKSTGALSEFYQETRTVAEEMRRAGLGMESWYRAFPILRNSMAEFRATTSEGRKELQRFVGSVEEAWGAGQQATKVMSFFTDAMGQSGTRAIETTRSFIDLARGLNMDVNAALTDLAATAPLVSMWGSRTQDVLRGLQEQSAATGVSMQRLVGVAEQFSTFEGAADAAGKLNAILGQTIFSSIDMIFMEHQERIEHIHGMLGQVGIAWGDLQAYEQRAIATTLNFGSVAEAAQVFTRSLEVQNREAQEAKARQEALSDAIRTSQTFFVRLTNTMRQLAVDMEPLAEKLGTVLSYLSQIFTAGNGWVGMSILFSGAVMRMVTSIAALSANLKKAGVEAASASAKVSMFSRLGRGAIGTASALGGLAVGGWGGGAMMGAGLGLQFGGLPGAFIGAGIGAIGGALTSYSSGGPIRGETILSNRSGPYAVAHPGERVVPAQQRQLTVSDIAEGVIIANRATAPPPPQPIVNNFKVGETVLESTFSMLHSAAHNKRTG